MPNRKDSQIETRAFKIGLSAISQLCNEYISFHGIKRYIRIAYELF